MRGSCGRPHEPDDEDADGHKNGGRHHAGDAGVGEGWFGVGGGTGHIQERPDGVGVGSAGEVVIRVLHL